MTTIDEATRPARHKPAKVAAFPVALVVAGVALALLLGLNEHTLAALSFAGGARNDAARWLLVGGPRSA